MTGSGDEAVSSAPEPTNPDKTPEEKLFAPNLIIQGLCIISVVAVAIYDLRTPEESVSPIVYGTLLGLYLGLDPTKIVKGFIK